MATVIELQTKIDTANSAKGIAELRKSLKELVSAQEDVGAGTAEFRKLQKAINDTEGRLGDLNDSFTTLRGSGVERLSSSFGLLTEGLNTFDGGKIKAAFNGIGAAMKAIPIFLIIEGVRFLIENFDELSKGNGVLAKALRGLGEVFDWLGDKITEFTDFIGLSNSALDKQGEAIKTNADKATEALATQTAEYDRQIAVAKASGKNVVDLEKQKQQAIIQTNFEIAKQIEAFVRAGGELDEEKKKQLTASLEAIRNAKTQEQVIEIEDLNKKREIAKKRADDKKKEEDDLFNQAVAEQERLEDFRTKQLEKERAEEIKLNEDRKKRLQELKDLQLKQDQEEVAAFIENERLKEEARKKELADEIAKQNAIIGINQSGFTALQGLSDTFFSIKQANTQKGTEEEEKAARKQFVINKALQIAQATVSGAQGVLQAATQPSGVPIPFDIPLRIAKAVAVAATTAATIAKISATQFQASGGGGGGSVSASIGGSGGGGGQAPAQTFTNIQGQRFDRSTVNQAPGGQTLNATVSVTEINRVQNKVAVTERRAKF